MRYKNQSTDEEIYCSNWKCNNTDCKRHHENQPWNVMMRQRRWVPDKNGKCEGELLKHVQR